MSDNILAKFVENLTFKQKFQMRLDREKFEQDGFIDECELRTQAERYIQSELGNFYRGGVVRVMNDLAAQIDREIADEYLKYIVV